VRSLLRICSVGSLLLLVAAASPPRAAAQEYAKLQVLLPGETEAPGTATGKLGAPADQVVGVPFTARVRACDADWNTVASITHTVDVTSSNENATITGPTALSGGTGEWTVTLNASGSFTVSAEDQTDPTIPVGTSANVTALLLQGFEFSRISQKNQYAGQPMTLSMEAVDPNGNRVTGFSGPVELTELTSYGEGRVQPSQVTLANGTWSGSLTFFRADETSINRGNVNVYAFLASDPTRNGTSDPFTVHPGPFARVQIVVPGQNPAPGSVSGVLGNPASQAAGEPFAVSLFSTDDYWNPLVSFDNVRVISSDAAASTPVNAALSNGFAQATLYLGTVGSQTLTITDLTNGSIQGMTTAAIPVIAAAVHHFVVEPIAGPLQAGAATSVTIRATDSTDNTIPGYDGDAVLTANTGPGSISPSQVTFTNGVWTGDITFRGAGGSVSLSCSDYSSPPHSGTSDPFVVLAGPYVGLQVLPSGQTPQGGTTNGYVGNPDDQNAGTAFNIRVRAVDAYWNRVPGIDNRLSISSSDEYAAFPDTPVLVNGEATLPVTLFKAGRQTISAADLDSTSIASHPSSEVTVLAGSYARLLILAPGQELAPGTEEMRAREATDQSISFAFTVTVYATDGWGNPASGVSDVVHISTSDPLAELPPDAALVDGVGEFILRLSTGGYQQITASNVTDPGVTSSTTQVRAISSGLHLEAEVTPTQVQAGEPFNLTVMVTNDAGAVIQEINTFVNVEVLNASTRDPGRGELLNTRFQLLQGQRTISQTYTAAESILLQITDESGNAPAVTEVITVLPGVPFAIQLSSDPAWVHGGKHATVSGRLVDAYDNGIPAQAMTFAVITGVGTITLLDDQTGVDGVARADFQAPRVPEVGRIQATAGTITAELDIETALVDPTAGGGLVTNYPNPFHPGESPTTIAYKLDDDATVRLRIFTLSGALVLEQEFPAGALGAREGLNQFTWDGKNGDGKLVSSGGYLLTIEAEGKGETLHSMRRKIGVVR
jgi:hypothetical protein